MYNLKKLLSNRGERAVTTIELAAVSAAIASLMAVAGTAVSGSDQKADIAACGYEKRLVINAVETAHADLGAYPEAAGVDGLGEVRDAGWLATEATYWVYDGVDADGRPTYSSGRIVEGCA